MISHEDVNTRHPAYESMRANYWQLVDDLLGGTATMRAAGTRWLPRFDGETDYQYRKRLEGSFLYNALRDTLRKLAARPFSRPVQVQTCRPLPAPLGALVQDADRAGNDITQFARQVFEKAVQRGLTHILVDYPAVPPGSTLADEQALGARPALVHVPPERLIAWRTVPDASGHPVLQQVRILEHHPAPSGRWGEVLEEKIRVITPATWELWRRNEDQKWVRESAGVNTLGRVPLVSCYLCPTGPLTGEPPLMDLAWLNLEHWQSSSDQRNILHWARVPILVGTGLSDDEIETQNIVAAGQMLSSNNEGARYYYVEHSGAAIEAGQRDLDVLESRMEVLGLQPLVERTGRATATARAIDESRSHNEIQAWVRAAENALEEAFRLAASWHGRTLPDDFQIDIFSDFALSPRASDDIRALLSMRQAGELSRETFLREIKRRGLLSDVLDINLEVRALA